MASEAHDLEHLELPTGEAPEPPRRRALRAVESVGADNTWIADVLDLPAHLIGELPAPVTFRISALDGSAFHVTGSAARAAGLRETGAIVLDREEWSALVLATEAERAWPADLVRALRVRGVSGRLSLESLLDGITVEQARRDAGRLFSMGKVLTRLGACLDAVRIEEVTSVGEGGAFDEPLEGANEPMSWELAS